MTQIVFVGKMFPQNDLLEQLVQQGYTVTVALNIDHMHHIEHLRNTVFIAMISDIGSASLLRTFHTRHHPSVPWLVWNCTGDSSLTLLAYASGASAVLPSDVNESILRTTVAAIVRPVLQERVWGGLQQRYRRGTHIRLNAQSFLEIKQGVIVQTMTHADGVETLLGLYGPGQVLIGHPDDECALQLYTHTDVVVTIQEWQALYDSVDMMDRLCERIRMMEAWASVQARPYLDERIIGLLGLMSEQFGVKHSLGMLVDVRITHGLLASALGATRSTVTRTLGDLRQRGRLLTIGKGEQERFCVVSNVGNHRIIQKTS